MKNQINERMLVLFIVIFFCLFTLFTPFQKAAAAGWVVEAVEDVNDAFNNFSQRALAIDQSGRPHVAYGGTHLHHAYFDGVQWQLEEIDRSPGVGGQGAGGGAMGVWATTAIDGNNRVHIFYVDKFEHLKYATNAGGTWVTASLDSTLGGGRNTSIALDALGKIHMSYFVVTGSHPDSTWGNIEYATNKSGVWVTTTVDSDVMEGFYPSLALDGDGKVHISYGAASLLKYATNASGSWVSTTADHVPNSNIFYTSIATDSSGRAHVSYAVYGVNTEIRYATNTSGSWVAVRADPGDAGENSPSSIAVDALGSVHIVYAGEALQGSWVYPVRYATNASGAWVSTTVDDGAGFTSFTLDPSGSAQIGYYANGEIRFATDATGSWVVTTVDRAVEAGRFNSLALDASGHAFISYVGKGSTEGLRYATDASGRWVTTTVDQALVEYTSVALDSSGNAHIVYREWLNFIGDIGPWAVLKHSTNAGGTWNTADIAGPGFVGADPSLAFDPSGKAHISYFDGYLSLTELKYATDASGEWETVTLDSPGCFGCDASIANDQEGHVHISYLSVGVLKYATNVSGSWVIADVGNSGGTGYSESSISMALDASGHVHISYPNNFDHGLRYSTNASGSWATTEIDSGVPLDYRSLYSSIAVDANGHAHISYVLFGNLRYATNLTGVWETTTLDSGAMYTFIALDAAGNPHISYYDTVNYTLKYARAANLTISPLPPVNFGSGSINVGSTSSPQVFTLTNSGTLDIQVNSTELSTGDAAMFAVRPGGTNPCLNITPVLPAGGGCTIEVVFTPASPGPKRTSLRIASNDPVNPAITVLLTGNGMLEPVFNDAPEESFGENFINTIAYHGLTSGCGNADFCPDSPISRAQMAVFLIGMLYGADPVCAGSISCKDTVPYFTDVPPDHWAFKFIQKMAEVAITGGCTATEFCPDTNVMRLEMAVFITTALSSPPEQMRSLSAHALSEVSQGVCTGTLFSDVNSETVGGDFCRFIEDFSALGITGGCQADDPLTADVNEARYCWDRGVTRAQMAVFLGRAFLGM